MFTFLMTFDSLFRIIRYIQDLDSVLIINDIITILYFIHLKKTLLTKCVSQALCDEQLVSNYTLITQSHSPLYVFDSLKRLNRTDLIESFIQEPTYTVCTVCI